MSAGSEEGLIKKTPDKTVNFLNKVVLGIVKILAILMVFVIIWSLADVVAVLYHHLSLPYENLFNTENVITTLGAFLASLIAIEVFLNIIFYLKSDAIHVPLVLATALTAIARKVIILDYTSTSDAHIYATAALVFAVGIIYWLATSRRT